MHLIDKNLEKAFKKDRQYLEKTQVPIVTISASYKEDVKGSHGLPENEFLPDVVFSRAHYSMALGTAIQAWGKEADHHRAWIVDPTNYVSQSDWQSIISIEVVGKAIARYPKLQVLKKLMDKFGRKKLPILRSITLPLLYLTSGVKKPILSFHIAAGNLLADHGKKVIQVITDPHVREDYLIHADSPLMTYCVFDERTKYEFLEKASLLKKKVNPKRIIVTGPPVDPRIIMARKNKTAWRNGQLKLCLCTGGLGTNKYELRRVLSQLLPQLRKHPTPYGLMLYAATHQDIAQMGERLAKEEQIKVNQLSYTTQVDPKKLNIIFHPQLLNANELLIQHAFPWADGFVTKPSGDMAYDAAASGSFLLTLKEWGEWEFNVREVFEQQGIAKVANSNQIVDQLQALTSSSGKSQSWVEQAMNKAFTVDPLFLRGCKNILAVSL